MLRTILHVSKTAFNQLWKNWTCNSAKIKRKHRKTTPPIQRSLLLTAAPSNKKEIDPMRKETKNIIYENWALNPKFGKKKSDVLWAKTLRKLNKTTISTMSSILKTHSWTNSGRKRMHQKIVKNVLLGKIRHRRCGSKEEKRGRKKTQ